MKVIIQHPYLLCCLGLVVLMHLSLVGACLHADPRHLAWVLLFVFVIHNIVFIICHFINSSCAKLNASPFSDDIPYLLVSVADPGISEPRISLNSLVSHLTTAFRAYLAVLTFSILKTLL